MSIIELRSAPLALIDGVESLVGANGAPMLFTAATGRYTRLSPAGLRVTELLDGRRTGDDLVALLARGDDQERRERERRVLRFLTGGRQPADRPQGQGELGRRRERGMAAQEEEREGVVVTRRRTRVRGGPLEDRGALLPVAPGAHAAPLVDQAPGGDGRKARARMLGNARPRPLERRGEQGLLHGVLAGVEAPVPPHERAENLRGELAQQVLDAGLSPQTSGGPSAMRRTSIGAWTKSTTRVAIATARASSSTSTIQ